MSSPSAPERFAAVVARLRAAGSVFAEDEARLLLDQAAHEAELEASLARRVAGVPLEQVLGWAEFCGLRVGVGAGVFVPRRRTGLLVREALAGLEEAADAGVARPVVVDLCCGSGAVALAVAAGAERVPGVGGVGGVELYAADIDPAAVRCARDNLAAVEACVYEGDLFEALPPSLRGRVDVLVANTPYVPTEAIATMPPEARLHEPSAALDGGADGLDVQRRVAASAPSWLAPGGRVLMETSPGQAAYAVGILERNGLLARVVDSEELDATAVVGARA